MAVIMSSGYRWFVIFPDGARYFPNEWKHFVLLRNDGRFELDWRDYAHMASPKKTYRGTYEETSRGILMRYEGGTIRIEYEEMETGRYNISRYREIYYGVRYRVNIIHNNSIDAGWMYGDFTRTE